MKPYIGLMGVRVTGILEKMIRDNIQMDVENLTCTGGRQLAVVPEQMRQMDGVKKNVSGLCGCPALPDPMFPNE